jgi:hypothetical protein
MAKLQIWFDGSIEDQSDAVLTHRSQSPIASGESIEGVTFHVESVGQIPVQISPVEDVGMGNQDIADLSDRSGYWQGIPSITPNSRPHSCRHD